MSPFIRFDSDDAERLGIPTQECDKCASYEIYMDSAFTRMSIRVILDVSLLKTKVIKASGAREGDQDSECMGMEQLVAENTELKSSLRRMKRKVNSFYYMLCYWRNSYNYGHIIRRYSRKEDAERTNRYLQLSSDYREECNYAPEGWEECDTCLRNCKNMVEEFHMFTTRIELEVIKIGLIGGKPVVVRKISSISGKANWKPFVFGKAHFVSGVLEAIAPQAQADCMAVDQLVVENTDLKSNLWRMNRQVSFIEDYGKFMLERKNGGPGGDASVSPYAVAQDWIW
jgi:hypothetical protein